MGGKSKNKSKRKKRHLSSSPESTHHQAKKAVKHVLDLGAKETMADSSESSSESDGETSSVLSAHCVRKDVLNSIVTQINEANDHQYHSHRLFLSATDPATKLSTMNPISIKNGIESIAGPVGVAPKEEEGVHVSTSPS